MEDFAFGVMKGVETQTITSSGLAVIMDGFGVTIQVQGG